MCWHQRPHRNAAAAHEKHGTRLDYNLISADRLATQRGESQRRLRLHLIVIACAVLGGDCRRTAARSRYVGPEHYAAAYDTGAVQAVSPDVAGVAPAPLELHDATYLRAPLALDGVNQARVVSGLPIQNQASAIALVPGPSADAADAAVADASPAPDAAQASDASGADSDSAAAVIPPDKPEQPNDPSLVVTVPDASRNDPVGTGRAKPRPSQPSRSCCSTTTSCGLAKGHSLHHRIPLRHFHTHGALQQSTHHRCQLTGHRADVAHTCNRRRSVRRACRRQSHRYRAGARSRAEGRTFTRGQWADRPEPDPRRSDDSHPVGGKPPAPPPPPAAPAPPPTPVPTPVPEVSTPVPSATKPPAAPPAAPVAAAAPPASSSTWIWPAHGPITSCFCPDHPLGIDIGQGLLGGQPIVAARRASSPLPAAIPVAATDIMSTSTTAADYRAATATSAPGRSSQWVNTWRRARCSAMRAAPVTAPGHTCTSRFT